MVHQGYGYVSTVGVGSFRKWRCDKRLMTSCKAAAILDEKNALYLKKVHNHAPPYLFKDATFPGFGHFFEDLKP